jgi:membrane-associated phospholipid phosphatase
LLYPVVLMSFFYRASGLLVEVVVPRFFDGAVTGLERTLFGIDPSLWLDAHPSVFLTEVLTAFYCTYYFLIPGLAVTLLFSRRDDDIKKFMTATCATFFISYLAFIFLPVAGPRFYFADLYQHKLVGVLFRPLADFIMDNAAFRGGAMPSSHVAVAVVAAFFAVRAYGRKAWFIVPVVVGLALGTVYGRYHYAIDVVIGAIIAGVVLYATIKYYPKEKMYLPQQQVADHPSARMYVSNSI